MPGAVEEGVNDSEALKKERKKEKRKLFPSSFHVLFSSLLLFVFCRSYRNSRRQADSAPRTR